MGVRLTVLEGPHQGQEFVFAEHDLFLAGRSGGAHFRLSDKDPYFSRLHFLIEINPPACRLIDLGSHNGTFVNENKVEVADLKNGDIIQVGPTKLRLTVEAKDELPATARYRAVNLPPEGTRPVTKTRSRPSLAPICLRCGTSTSPGPLCANCRDYVEKQPQPIPNYRLVKELGTGRLGTVWLAVRHFDNLPVALTTIIPKSPITPGRIEHLLREARVLEHLDHPHITAYFDAGQAGGHVFFAMEYAAGVDSAQVLEQQGPLPVPRAVNLICQLLEALQYAHEHGFVHRDIRPGNLTISEDPDSNGRDFLKLANFGLGRVYEASPLSGLTITDHSANLTPFMAPEQITAFREPRRSVDQYAVAATLYHLLTGAFIYDLPAKLSEQVTMLLMDDPVPLKHRRSDLPSGLVEIVHRPLARDPKHRYPDVWTMRAALAEFE